MVDLGDERLPHDAIDGALASTPHFVTELKGPTAAVVKHLGDSLRYS